MPASASEIIVAFIAITIVLVLLVIFLISFTILFQRRQAQFRVEKQATAEAHARELLQTQLETQNQTLQQIAEDIHDHVEQLLSLMTLQLQVLADEVRDLPALSRVETVQESLRTTLRDVRDLTKLLHTDTVRQFGLHHCLQLDLDRITRTRRCQATFITTRTLYDLGTDTAIFWCIVWHRNRSPTPLNTLAAKPLPSPPTTSPASLRLPYRTTRRALHPSSVRATRPKPTV